MFSHKHYVPILRSKGAELSALKGLTPAIMHDITPLIDVMGAPWDYVNDKPKKDMKSHLDDTAANLIKCWKGSDPIFIDLMYAASDGQAISGLHAVEYFFSLLKGKINIIPVTAPDRDNEYQAAVDRVVKFSNNGLIA